MPSYGELNEIKTILSNASDIHNYLLVPFAGQRHYDNFKVSYLGQYTYLWSSSAWSDSNPGAYELTLNVNEGI